MPWKINDQVLDFSKFSVATLSLKSQGTDELQLVAERLCDDPVYAEGTWCELKNPAGDVVFAGEAKVVQGTGEGENEQNITQILGPWNDLERISWRVGTDLRCTFPSVPTETMPTGVDDAIAQVLAEAISLGARLQIGVIDVGGVFPAMQFDNTTIAAIILGLLRFSPGACTFFDYSTSPPTLNIIAASELDTLEIEAAGSGGLSITPRTDSRILGVMLVYRKKIITSYGEAEGTQLDIAGVEDNRGRLVMALDLNPAQAQYTLLENRIKVAAVNPNSNAWWANFGVDEEGSIALSETGDTDLDYYVTAGALQSWMLSEINGEANPDPNGCSGPLSERPGDAPIGSQAFSETAPDLNINNELSFRLGKRSFQATFSASKRTYKLDLPVTDLSVSGAYYRESLASWDKGEDVPIGLAAKFLAGASRLTYSENLRLQQKECTPDVHRPGLKLRILGTAWDEIDSPIYGVTHSLTDGASTLEFGPTGYLGPGDLLELYRAAQRDKSQRPDAEASQEPAPVQYNAVVASASESMDPGVNGLLTITLTVPTDLPTGDCRWTAHGPETYQGAGEDVIEVVPGKYTVIFHPVFKISDGLIYWSESQVEVDITADGGSAANGSYDAVQRMFVKASNQEDPTGFDLNAQDIIDFGVPEGKALVKARLVDFLVDGAFQKAVAPSGDTFTFEG